MGNFRQIENVKKIAVLRAGSLGDLIVTLPCIFALRETYPEAEISLLGSPWQETFFVRGRSPVDRVIVVPPVKGIRSAVSDQDADIPVNDFLSRMQREKFDVVISLQGKGIAANPLIRQMGARVTVGTWTNGAAVPDRYVSYYYYQHEVLRYLEVAKLAGAGTSHIAPRIEVLEQDRREAEQRGLTAERYVILNPMANDHRRMWPLNNYVSLADRLSERGYNVFFSGSSADSEDVDKLIGLLKLPAINACGLTFGGLAALASGALLMIGPDTGPIHLAQAVGCPTAGIYWAPNLINWGPLFRNVHQPVVSWNLQCPVCGETPIDPHPFEPRTSCSHEVSFVRDVAVDEVLNAALNLLSIHDDINTHESGSTVSFQENLNSFAS